MRFFFMILIRWYFLHIALPAVLYISILKNTNKNDILKEITIIILIGGIAMNCDFGNLKITAEGEAAQKAAQLFADEVLLRGCACNGGGEAQVHFAVDSKITDKDSYRIELVGTSLSIFACGIRGLIYGYSLFLRKCVVCGGSLILTQDISGAYSPNKKIRGHQCGYRTCSNTYDAWDKARYRRFYLDIMAFGSNTCEHIPNAEFDENNPLMRSAPYEAAIWGSELAKEFDIDVSFWYPNDDEQSEAEALAERERFFAEVPRLQYFFPPGGDPGEMNGDDFVERCVKLSAVMKSHFPDAQMWPSAQAPHSKPNWGEDFIREMEKLPNEIDGVIAGPNHAFALPELRRRLPEKYPIRFYPDITHNLRCEYPVHYEEDDWHYALASTLSRESINPRPLEFARLYSQTEPFVIGSVTYSEGANDDVNKMLWGNFDYFGSADVREALLDYARFFIWQGDAEKISDAILGLEQNWVGDPKDNSQIDRTLDLLEAQEKLHPQLNGNWRFLSLLFRARCDKLVALRRKSELDLIKKARRFADENDFDSALKILKTDFSYDYYILRASLDQLAARLFDLIGLQLDTEHYHASAWERGATLDTLDRPVTDRLWLLNRFAEAEGRADRDEFLHRVFERNRVGKGECYFSFAEQGLAALGEKQSGEFYMDYQGDRPNVNNGSVPMCVLKCFDHFSLRCNLGGFEKCDYKMRVTYKATKRHTDSFCIKANGRVIFSGDFYGEKDERFEREMLSDNYTCAVYSLPQEVFENGNLRLEWSEESYGVIVSEFMIYKESGYGKNQC